MALLPSPLSFLPDSFRVFATVLGMAVLFFHVFNPSLSYFISVAVFVDVRPISSHVIELWSGIVIGRVKRASCRHKGPTQAEHIGFRGGLTLIKTQVLNEKRKTLEWLNVSYRLRV